ncbi:adhesion G-protein coupled receptor G5-like isoform X2 [Polypterus senegalus]|uniref:adhesion G-protein coupled receptor G5-like isoform X2 n=1 Tax=Polypterus senegalus TaxID=55291 RepID=UPI001963B408|nr:adhesion G-protein coupled receptor G5-like isoform X2 [Polypterus senegalus]
MQITNYFFKSPKGRTVKCLNRHSGGGGPGNTLPRMNALQFNFLLFIIFWLRLEAELSEANSFLPDQKKVIDGTCNWTVSDQSGQVTITAGLLCSSVFNTGSDGSGKELSVAWSKTNQILYFEYGGALSQDSCAMLNNECCTDYIPENITVKQEMTMFDMKSIYFSTYGYLSINLIATVQICVTVSCLESLDDDSETNSGFQTYLESLNYYITSCPCYVQETGASRMIQNIEDMMFQRQISSHNVTFVTSNLIAFMTEITVDTFTGLSFGTDLNNAFFNTNGINNLTTSVTLPEDLFKNIINRNHLKILFLVMTNATLFQNVTNLLHNLVIDIAVQNTSISNLSSPVVLNFFISQSMRILTNKPLCVFWIPDSNGTGIWSTFGCTTKLEDTMVICNCYHLSYFAVLMGPCNEEDNMDALSYISYIGCGVSVFFLTIVLLLQPTSSIVSKEKITDLSWFIHFNLAGALLLLNIGFLCSATIPAIQGIHWLCITTGLLLHFFLICSFTWMALEAFQMWLLIWRQSQSILKGSYWRFCLVGWGVPGLLVLTVIAVKHVSYGISKHMCWITIDVIIYTTVIGYYALVFIFICGVLVAVFYKLNQTKCESKKAEKNKRNIYEYISTFLGLACLCGFTWGLGFFLAGSSNLAVEYLFTILNSLQGFFLFIWICTQKNKGRTFFFEIRDEKNASCEVRNSHKNKRNSNT